MPFVITEVPRDVDEGDLVKDEHPDRIYNEISERRMFGSVPGGCVDYIGYLS